MAETLDVTSMLPNKFEPKRKNRWILMIEGIDAYIIKTTARPTVTTEEVGDAGVYLLSDLSRSVTGCVAMFSSCSLCSLARVMSPHSRCTS